MKGYQYFMQDFKVNILGSEWNVKFGSEKEYPNLTNVDGYTDLSIREIVVDDMEASQGQIGTKADLESYQKQVVRHEIIHAFLLESGLDSNSNSADSWAVNEEMVDWFAIQSPKIFKVFNELKLM
nr:MAG TPA_asm: Protein of unknown function (DUF1570) [Caudoviricetes sp.]